MSITAAKLAQLFLHKPEITGISGTSRSSLCILFGAKLSGGYKTFPFAGPNFTIFFGFTRFSKKQIFQPTTFVSFSLFFVFQDTKQAFRPAGSAVERKIYAAETFCVGFLKVYYK